MVFVVETILIFYGRFDFLGISVRARLIISSNSTFMASAIRSIVSKVQYFENKNFEQNQIYIAEAVRLNPRRWNWYGVTGIGENTSSIRARETDYRAFQVHSGPRSMVWRNGWIIASLVRIPSNV